MNKPSEALDFRNEDLEKNLDIHSLAETICEYFFNSEYHDEEYLLSRIKVLRNFFGIGSEENSESSRAVDALLSGYGKMPALQILPLDGALEVPSSLEGETHQEISRQYETEISNAVSTIRKIQKNYIITLITHAVPGRMRAKSISLKSAIVLGLPDREPEITDEDLY